MTANNQKDEDHHPVQAHTEAIAQLQESLHNGKIALGVVVTLFCSISYIGVTMLNGSLHSINEKLDTYASASKESFTDRAIMRERQMHFESRLTDIEKYIRESRYKQ